MNRDGTSSELDRDREDAEDRQQLFVQQIAEALLDLFPYVSVNSPDGVALTHAIAPRIAAAIHAAAQAVWDGDTGGAIDNAALAALRGAARAP